MWRAYIRHPPIPIRDTGLLPIDVRSIWQLYIERTSCQELWKFIVLNWIHCIRNITEGTRRGVVFHDQLLTGSYALRMYHRVNSSKIWDVADPDSWMVPSNRAGNWGLCHGDHTDPCLLKTRLSYKIWHPEVTQKLMTHTASANYRGYYREVEAGQIVKRVHASARLMAIWPRYKHKFPPRCNNRSIERPSPPIISVPLKTVDKVLSCENRGRVAVLRSSCQSTAPRSQCCRARLIQRQLNT